MMPKHGPVLQHFFVDNAPHGTVAIVYCCRVCWGISTLIYFEYDVAALQMVRHNFFLTSRPITRIMVCLFSGSFGKDVIFLSLGVGLAPLADRSALSLHAIVQSLSNNGAVIAPTAFRM